MYRQIATMPFMSCIAMDENKKKIWGKGVMFQNDMFVTCVRLFGMIII